MHIIINFINFINAKTLDGFKKKLVLTVIYNDNFLNLTFNQNDKIIRI